MRPSPNSTQSGVVTYLGMRPKSEENHIRTYTADSLTFNETGVVGDSHSMYYLPQPTRVYPAIKPEVIQDKLSNGYRIFKTAQVHILGTQTANMLSEKFGISLNPGEVGEQILVDGIDFNMLHEGTTVSIGSDVKFKIVSTRTFCRKFSYDITNPFGIESNAFHNMIRTFILTADRNALKLPPHIGVYVQVIKTGIINVGDTVTVDPTTSPFYATSEVPKVAVEARDINAKRFQWFTKEELLAIDTLSTKDQIENYFK